MLRVGRAYSKDSLRLEWNRTNQKLEDETPKERIENTPTDPRPENLKAYEHLGFDERKQLCTQQINDKYRKRLADAKQEG